WHDLFRALAARAFHAGPSGRPRGPTPGDGPLCRREHGNRDDPSSFVICICLLGHSPGVPDGAPSSAEAVARIAVDCVVRVLRGGLARVHQHTDQVDLPHLRINEYAGFIVMPFAAATLIRWARSDFWKSARRAPQVLRERPWIPRLVVVAIAGGIVMGGNLAPITLRGYFESFNSRATDSPL